MSIELKYEDLKEAGYNIQEGLTYCGNSEKYLATLQRFYRRLPKTKEEIAGAAGESDYEALIIVAHALKSNARAIGADTLASVAEHMELLGRDGKNDEMIILVDALNTELDKVGADLEPYGRMEEVHPVSEITTEQAEEIGEKLIGAIEDFDSDTAIGLIDELMRYPFRFTLINVLKNARGDLLEYEYNEALLKVRRVISQIED